ncbi:MAG: hypothetical protein ACJ8G7_04490 [Rhizobacter sp.]
MARIHAMTAALACALLVPAAGSAASPDETAGAAVETAALPPLDQIIDGSLMPQLEFLFDKLLAERRDITLDGTRAFNGGDKFLPGKIAIGFSYLVLARLNDPVALQKTLAGYRDIADMTIDDANETWGVYYYMSAIWKLQQAGLLDQAISAPTLAKLRSKLDWRPFVNQTDWSLVNLPTNYYGVAFSIARLRYLMGWEDASASETLLAKTIEHYTTFSSGFSDETNGEGRFDRYSVLLIGEICQRHLETGMAVTPQLEVFLRNSVDVILARLNEEGDGFDYGRSIGAYGDTAFLEVLSAAAQLGVLTEREREMAYAFAVRASSKYVSFWYDPQMQSVNLWEKGRRTDGYRNKNRILGENLSLAHQHIYTARQWARIGYTGRAPSPAFHRWLEALPRYTTTWYATGDYDRALFTVRDGEHVFSLNVVNGGSGQHMNNPYYPIPYSSRIIQGAADTSWPQLVPRFVLADGTQLAPLSWFKNIRNRTVGPFMEVSWHMDEMDKLGASAPAKDTRLRVDTRYVFGPGMIGRVDEYQPAVALDFQKVSLEFAGFSDDATVRGNVVRFGRGAVRELAVFGLGDCAVDSVAADPLYRSPMAQMTTRVTCSLQAPPTQRTPFTIGWVMHYR